MDNVNKDVVNFYEKLGFTLVEIKSSVFRVEESTLVFQTDHKNHTVDASTILYSDAERVYTQAHQAGIDEAEKIMESMKEDGETPFGHQELHETELAYNQALDDTIKALTDKK